MKELKIYFTTDIHGYFSPINYADGSRISSGAACCFNDFEKNGNTLVIDGGDTLQGSPFTYFLHKTGNTENLPARVMNLGGYDFYTLGNHDFNYGLDVLQQYIDTMEAQCLCANVEGLRGIEKTAIVTLENGLRIGLTGITTHFINVWEKPHNLEGITITHPVPAAEEALRELKSAGVDLTVCVYHGGFENDLETGASLSETEENQGYRICKELDFDILLTGHQHIPMENKKVFCTHTCQTADKAKHYAEIHAVQTEEGWHIRSALHPAGENPVAEAEKLLATAEQAAAEWLDTPVGHLSVELQPRDHLDMAVNGCAIANFFNQVQLAVSGADISCTSLANEVKGFTKDVSIRDVAATYIYPNTLATLEVDRSVLKTALERCAEYFDYNMDGSLRVSDVFLKPKVEHYNYDYFTGIEVVMDLRRSVGDRVVSIQRNGEELPEGVKYTLCMNNYRSSGTGGYEVFKTCSKVSEQPTEIAELIMEYISSNGNILVDTNRHLKVIY